MKSITKKIYITSLMALPMLSFGQTFNVNVPTSNVRSINDVTRIIVSLVNWITGLFFVAAILALFYSAYLYLGAAGDEDRMKKAKETLIYSIIAIAVALLAGSMRFIVESVLRL